MKYITNRRKTEAGTKNQTQARLKQHRRRSEHKQTRMKRRRGRRRGRGERARRSASYLIMSNAGTAFSFEELVDAASLPIAWTSRRPRIKIGLRPTARGRFLPPAAEQSLSRSSTRNEQEAATKFPGKFVRRRGAEEGGWEEEEERAAMAMGAEPGVQIEALSFAVFRFCPRVGLRIHRSATASGCPNCPRVGRGSVVICGEFVGFLSTKAGEIRAASSLALQATGRSRR